MMSLIAMRDNAAKKIIGNPFLELLALFANDCCNFYTYLSHHNASMQSVSSECLLPIDQTNLDDVGHRSEPFSM